ncbi:acyl-CoA dehydrogenase [Gluconacetobacter aggeris]|uniref:Dibenzothiophene monooxygenase n=1 Tax=Gluconacetobacter aggeris TaxID=1286186 RepID=A0A7W4IQN2_9PROT|nr:acyl-CoA dehydrogenase family protein [Gluconacetobacter aggeris]MBB2167285.1 acyl-CoA dehydrogenase [Gluconacetobacter aggeris]
MDALTQDAPAPVAPTEGGLREVFARIAKGAVAREQGRVLPYEAVAWLREVGFGTLRVPREAGGAGVGLVEIFRLLTELAAADSNLPQIVRAHFAFIEGLRHEPDRARSASWYARIVDGALFGAAMAELTDSTGTSTTLTRQGEGWRLDGTKYYSTGTLYADWIIVVADEAGERVRLAVPATAPGVTRDDDWDGFGQRLTGSGTTRFDGVAVSDGQILARSSFDLVPSSSFLTAYYQLFHLATLAGIGRAALRDAVAFVRPRTRTFGVPGKVSQRHDPLVQQVVGRLSALAYSTSALVEDVARALERGAEAWDAGVTEHPLYDEAERIAFQAQQIVLEQTLEATTRLFEVGGASATASSLGLDRHWRNARVLASHNPAVQRARALGDLELNGTALDAIWRPASPTTERTA